MEQYDQIFCEHYSEKGFSIIEGQELLDMLETEPHKKTALASAHLSKIYESASGNDCGDSNLYLDWKWKIAVSKAKPFMILGAIGYEPMSNTSAYVSYLYIRKAYQRQGIGKSLISSLRFKNIILKPETNMSHAFFKHLGFAEYANGFMSQEH